MQRGGVHDREDDRTMNHKLILAMAERIYAQSELLSRKAEKKPMIQMPEKHVVVSSKQQMYQMLSAGLFGNTTKQWYDVATWKAEAPEYHYWGVRTLQPGGPCRLFCPCDEVEVTCRQPTFVAAGINISMMIDTITNVTLWAEVYESDTGLVVYGMEYPPKKGSWRLLMPSQGRHWYGLEAKMLLRKHLWPSSLSDLEELLEKYDGHVVEFSACEDAVGVLKDRNGVVWEVRAY